MEELGAPIAYLALAVGTPVYASDGERVGEVQHILAAEDKDIFDGLVIDIRPGPGGLRFVDAPEVGDLHERGVVLKIDSAAVEQLHEPSPNPGALRVDPADGGGSALTAKLRRAWDLISGRY
jgi:sporulation protein YlmC with PRC-barrel domain